MRMVKGHVEINKNFSTRYSQDLAEVEGHEDYHKMRKCGLSMKRVEAVPSHDPIQSLDRRSAERTAPLPVSTRPRRSIDGGLLGPVQRLD